MVHPIWTHKHTSQSRGKYRTRTWRGNRSKDLVIDKQTQARGRENIIPNNPEGAMTGINTEMHVNLDDDTVRTDNPQMPGSHITYR